MKSKIICKTCYMVPTIVKKITLLSNFNQYMKKRLVFTDLVDHIAH